MTATLTQDTTVNQTQRAINQLDLTNVTLRLSKEPGWHLADAKTCEGLYRNFLFLMAKYGPTHGELVPSIEIDEYWHNHILFTRQYFSDCEKIFGAYRHHTPQIEDSNSTTSNTQQLFEQTQALYFKEFGAYL